MTTLDTTIAILHAHLDETPADWTLRRVLADAYKEANDIDRAAFQRWMAEKETRPFAASFSIWTWCFASDNDGCRSGISNFEILYRLKGTKNDTAFEYPTRQAAEDDLFQAWVAWREQQ